MPGTSTTPTSVACALSWAARIIHHSDRGSQYASYAYRDALAAHGITVSMSRAGDCWDNAMMESFFGTYKQEWAHHHRWRGLHDMREATHDYIEVFYNRQRLQKVQHAFCNFEPAHQLNETC